MTLLGASNGLAPRGAVRGLILGQVSCENETTGQTIEIADPDPTGWDCELAGLLVAPDDLLRQKRQGVVE